MLTKDHIPINFIFHKIKKETIWITLYMLLTFYLDDLYKIDNSLYIPNIIISILGTNISLVLSFKTNHAYQRWLTARNSWGKIKSHSITLIQQLQCFLSEHELKSFDITKFVNRQIGITYMTERKLRGKDIKDLMNKYFDDENEQIFDSENITSSLFNLQFRTLKKMVEDERLDKTYQIEIIKTLNSINEEINICFTIKNTVFPILYSLYVKWMLTLFVIILPLALIDFNKYIEFFLVTSISLLFFLMEKTSSYLQDPFENLPTDVNALSIATDIDIVIKRLLKSEDIPNQFNKNKFYVM